MSRTDIKEELSPRLTAIGVVVLAALLIIGVFFLFSVVTIDEGDRGVLKTQGAVTGDVLEPGWHVVIPFYQSVERIEVRPQTHTMSGDVHEGEVEQEDAISFRSADQQQVGTDITVRYTIEESEVDEFHTEYNTIAQFEQRLLRPETIDTVAREGSGFDATEANSEAGRAEIGDVVQQSLTEESPAYVTIESVQVRDIHLDPDYQASLEEVEIAQQEAEAERTRAQGDADAERIRAEGEADALQEVQEALEEENLALEQIRAYDEGTIFVTDGGTPVILDPDNPSVDETNSESTEEPVTGPDEPEESD